MKNKIFVLLTAAFVLTGCGMAEDTLSTETISIENESAATSSLDDELASIDEKASEMEADISNNDHNQQELNEIANNIYILWDDELNSLWNRFSESSDADFKEKILAEQREWISTKEARVSEAGVNYEGGSMQSMVEDLEAARLTRIRVYALAGYLGQVTGESVTPFSYDYAGYYVDTQGTMEAYSTLELTADGENTYTATIGLYRVSTFEGAVTLEGNTLTYTDNEGLISGQITIDVDTDSATFIVTESSTDLVSVGEEWVFPEKW